MSSPLHHKLSTSDKKDLDKFTKYLSIKAVQAVVQSRLGEKSNMPSIFDTSGGTSWYNLAIRDIPEVLTETKRAMSGHLPSPGRPLVVEVSLKTVEGDSLVLEWWRLSVVAGGDSQVKVTHTVYNRMGLLLKSLITVTRVTPAYRLSRTQGQDSYVICYRVFLGEPADPPDLGEGALTARVGQVTTPVSTIVCCVDYRTSMTITPQQATQPILVKSDHFEARDDITPRMLRREYRTSESSEQGVTSDESQEMRLFATSPPDRPKKVDDEGGEKMRFGAFARTESLPCLEEELQEPLLNLLPRPRPGSAVSVTSGETSGTDSHTDTQFLMSSDSGKLAERGIDRGGSGFDRSSSERGRGRAHSLGNKTQHSQSPGPGFPGMKKCFGDALNEEKSNLERRSSGTSLSAGGGSAPTAAVSEPVDTGAPVGGCGADRRSIGDVGRRLSGTGGGTSIFGTSELDREFVMIDLKTPFAAQPSSSAEGSSVGGTGTDPSLGSFFKDVSSAPSLQSLPNATGPIRETLQTWHSQIDTFESNMQQYEDFLDDIGSASELEN